MQSKILAPLSSALMVLSLLLLAACGGGATSTSGTGTPTSKNPADIHVGFVSETSSEDFAAEMAAGAQYAANQFHVSAQIVAPANENDEQSVSLFQGLTRTARDGIAVETLAPALFIRAEANAVSQGIPVIAVDTAPPAGTNITTYVGNDNFAAGETLAQEAIKHLAKNAKGTVVVGIDTPGIPPLEYRFQGIKQAFKDALPGVTVLGPYDSQQEPDQNYQAWNNLIKAHPGALAYIGVGDPDNSSLARIKEANKGTYLTSAFDLDPTALQAVANGTNYALLDPEHFLKGYVAMRLLIEHALYGTTIPTGWWNPGDLLVNQSNVQQIITRQKTLASKGAFYLPIITKEFADPAAQIKPLSEAR